jgi:hypothetical protein
MPALHSGLQLEPAVAQRSASPSPRDMHSSNAEECRTLYLNKEITWVVPSWIGTTGMTLSADSGGDGGATVRH